MGLATNCCCMAEALLWLACVCLLTLSAIGIPVAFIYTRLAYVLYVVVALMWFVPDRRIESII